MEFRDAQNLDPSPRPDDTSARPDRRSPQPDVGPGACRPAVPSPAVPGLTAQRFSPGSSGRVYRAARLPLPEGHQYAEASRPPQRIADAAPGASARSAASHDAARTRRPATAPSAPCGALTVRAGTSSIGAIHDRNQVESVPPAAPSRRGPACADAGRNRRIARSAAPRRVSVRSRQAPRRPPKRPMRQPNGPPSPARPA